MEKRLQPMLAVVLMAVVASSPGHLLRYNQQVMVAVAKIN